MSDNANGAGDNPAAYLSADDASKFLQGLGLPVAVGTLAKLRVATVGGGPRFVRFGRTPLYTPDALKSWAASKLSSSEMVAA